MMFIAMPWTQCVGLQFVTLYPDLIMTCYPALHFKTTNSVSYLLQ